MQGNDIPAFTLSENAFNGETGDARYYNPQLNTLHTDQVWPAKTYSIWPGSNKYEFLHHQCISLLKKHLDKEKRLVFKKSKLCMNNTFLMEEH